MRFSRTERWEQSPKRDAFTLVEMLMVLVIIGLIISIALPGIKGLKRTNVEANANRQLLDDLALARQRAIVGRTTVHVVFVPTNILITDFSALAKPERDQVERLKSGIFTTYALFVERSLGDQPGQPNFKYITTWKSLPEGMMIRQTEFNQDDPPDVWKSINPVESREFLHLLLPFPSANGMNTLVPQIAFGPHGGLVDDKGNRLLDDEVIEVTRGSIFFDRDQNGLITGVDAKGPPNYNPTEDRNWIRIDGLTGRAKVDRKEIQ
jgi:prepilin-type N-terminal cleavage/methylation domain-containing protein